MNKTEIMEYISTNYKLDDWGKVDLPDNWRWLKVKDDTILMREIKGDTTTITLEEVRDFATVNFIKNGGVKDLLSELSEIMEHLNNEEKTENTTDGSTNSETPSEEVCDVCGECHEETLILSTPQKLLLEGIKVFAERAKTRGVNEEDKMGHIVKTFSALTGVNMTEEQGNLFMVILKLVRSQSDQFNPDDYVDGVNYLAMAGASRAKKEQL